ncbi:unnamed protein product [Dracunculus medinensis]|uniref:Coiled-coil domain-containing protein 186 n=1 Tax=Dracunculus medinensis TaxID=318479 RepID=A0A158Q2M4_DRAME|nr:unnamed protein product [Dracunculus medinensis]
MGSTSQSESILQSSKSSNQVEQGIRMRDIELETSNEKKVASDEHNLAIKESNTENTKETETEISLSCSHQEIDGECDLQTAFWKLAAETIRKKVDAKCLENEEISHPDTCALLVKGHAPLLVVLVWPTALAIKWMGDRLALRSVQNIRKVESKKVGIVKDVSVANKQKTIADCFKKGYFKVAEDVQNQSHLLLSDCAEAEIRINEPENNEDRSHTLCSDKAVESEIGIATNGPLVTKDELLDPDISVKLNKEPKKNFEDVHHRSDSPSIDCVRAEVDNEAAKDDLSKSDLPATNLQPIINLVQSVDKESEKNFEDQSHLPCNKYAQTEVGVTLDEPVITENDLFDSHVSVAYLRSLTYCLMKKLDRELKKNFELHLIIPDSLYNKKTQEIYVVNLQLALERGRWKEQIADLEFDLNALISFVNDSIKEGSEHLNFQSKTDFD